MYEIPESLEEAQQVAEKRHMDLSDVIRDGLQNWIQELLAEGFEGNYFTAKLGTEALHIISITGEEAFVDSEITYYVN